MNALELARRHGVVFNWDRQPPDPRVSEGPLGTAHARSTSPDSRRKSKCSVVASCSCTTNRGAGSHAPVCPARGPAPAARYFCRITGRLPCFTRIPKACTTGDVPVGGASWPPGAATCIPANPRPATRAPASPAAPAMSHERWSPSRQRRNRAENPPGSASSKNPQPFCGTCLYRGHGQGTAGFKKILFRTGPGDSATSPSTPWLLPLATVREPQPGAARQSTRTYAPVMGIDPGSVPPGRRTSRASSGLASAAERTGPGWKRSSGPPPRTSPVEQDDKYFGSTRRRIKALAPSWRRR